MRIGSLVVGAVALSLASSAYAACPAAPSAPVPPLGGPAGETFMGRMKQVPPPTRHLPIPAGPLDSVQIKLQRSGCFGTCPAYSIELRGDGAATYVGGNFVLVQGEHHFKISPETVSCLLTQFASADFWSLNDSYVASITDNPYQHITLSVGGQSKTLTDYVGRAVGMPAAVTELENAIDRAGADQWVRGSSDTLASLRAEHFDFHSRAAGEMLAFGAEAAPNDFLLGLIAEGAPATGQAADPRGDDEGTPAIVAAAFAGRANIVSALIAGGALTAPAGVKEVALQAAAASLKPDVVAQILKAGPDINARNAEGQTALMAIKNAYFAPDRIDTAADPAGVAKLLLAAGADPRLADNRGETALHFANGGEYVRVLLAAGAGLETRDKDGRTPLLSANDDAAAVALIEAGADINAKAPNGDTVEGLARQFKYQKTLALLAARRGDAKP